MDMETLDVVSLVALLLSGLILLVLLMQYLRLRDIWQKVIDCQKSARLARIREMENRELHSALRAHKAHVEQLQRKLVLLQT
jgi:hypothetical protein